MKLFERISIEFKTFQLLFPRRDRVLILAGLTLLAFLLVFVPSLTDNLDRMLLDLKTGFNTRYINTDFSSDFLILSVDSETLRTSPHKWPWPQDYWAEVLKKIRDKLEPQMVVFDIYFQENERDAVSAKFIDEIRQSGNVGLVAVFEEHFSVRGQQLKVFPPIEKLGEAAYFWGMSQFPIDKDGVIRSFLLFDYRLEKLHVAWEASSALPGFVADKSSFEDMQTARVIMNFKHEERRIPQVPIHKVFREDFNHPRLKGKIVIVGATAPILHDYHQTSVGIISGPELVGNAIESVYKGKMQFIHSSWQNRLLYFLLGLVFAFLPFFDFVTRRWRLIVAELILLPPLLMAFSFFPAVHPPIEITLISYLVFQSVILVMLRMCQLNLINQSLHEAEICGKIQKKFFPAKPLIVPNVLDIDGRCIPFQNAGGDYYDYFINKAGNLVFFLGDVAGHGISASMLTTAAKSVVLINAEKEDFAVGDLLMDMNSAILSLINKRMMTVVSGVVDFSDNKIKLFSAGHLPAVLKTPEGIQELKIAGLPLGISKRFKLMKSLEIPVPETGKLIIYSDGIVEAVNWENELMGFDLFYDAIEQMPMEYSTDQTLDYIYSFMDKHVSGRAYQDDVTVLVLSFCKGEIECG